MLVYWRCQTCYSYETHDHSFTDGWSTSGSHHWKQCSVDNGYCKFVSDYAEHDYGSETGTTCVICGYTRTICDHTYSEGFNSWDETNHWRECTNPNCTAPSEARKDKETHTLNSYGDCTECGYRHSDHAYGSWHFDGSGHWKTCQNPGCEIQTEKTGHTYKGNICSVCGYDRSITPAHTHFYGQWSKDSQNHWRECSDPNCPEETGRIIDKAAHVYGSDADTTCALCGYVRSVDPDHSGGHIYGDWSWDVNSHWHECTDPDCPDKGGSIQDKTNHVYDDDGDYDCNDCGYVRSTSLSHTHTFDGWRYDAERHYRICSAEDCPYWGEELDSAPHVYDDDQDEFCNVCAYGRFGTQHEHIYGAWTADGETGHYRVCTDENCPYADKGRQTEAHSYDDDADADCNVCGYERTITPPAHEHSYGAWSHDETNHWHACTDADCPDRAGSVKDTAVHVYDDDANATCNVCGYERTITPPAHEHSYGAWSHDETNHWHECTDADCPDRAGSIKDTATHVYDDDADATCNVCGYERTITPPAHEHSYGAWSHDETSHWHACTDADCPDKTGSVKDTAAHVYDDDADATCNVCGYERTVTPPPAAKRQVVVVDSYAPITGAGQYAVGAPVVIYAGSRENYTFVGWTSDDVVITNPRSAVFSFLMPDKNVTIKANWVYTGGGSDHSCYTIKATAGTGGSISPSGNVSVREGADQTFTITPDKGYAVSNVKIDGKSIGAVKSYTFENVSRTHTIEVIFMKANGNPQTGVFVDVATGSYYEDAVDWAVENGITQGTDDTHFSPDGICTRAQAVTFLWRNAGSPAPKTNTMPFTDVNAGSYYYDAVLWAVENGITEGTSDTTFSPNATCTRARIVTFLWRSEMSPAAGTANPFADVKSTAYYANAVLWAVKAGITKGTTNTTFSPDADCTRAQIVTFLWRCKK